MAAIVPFCAIDLGALFNHYIKYEELKHIFSIYDFDLVVDAIIFLQQINITFTTFCVFDAVRQLVLLYVEWFFLPETQQLTASGFLRKMGQPRPLFHLFLSFLTHITIFTTKKCEKCPSSILYRDSNSRPLAPKSPPMTTRPGLLQYTSVCYSKNC